MRKSGFTLVEMLVVMSVLSIVSVFILNIFTRTLRGSNKSQIISTIKQNGQSVLDAMDKTVRNADNIVCVSTPPVNLIVIKNGIYTRYRFIPPSVTVNGFIQQDNPSKQIDSQTNKEETDSALVNRICASADPMLQPVALTDTKTQTGVSVANGLFVRDRSGGFRDQLTIKFDIGPPVGSPQAISGQIDSVSFQTTIQLR